MTENIKHAKKEHFHFPRHSLMELVGIFPHEEAIKMRKRIEENRKASQERIDRIAKRLK